MLVMPSCLIIQPCVTYKYLSFSTSATMFLYSGQSNHRAEQIEVGGENTGTGMPPVPHAGQ